ncbi:hypothetical protein GGI21_002103, partial [Coemansia aciculifera]
MADGAPPASSSKAQGFRDAITSKLRLGKGGNKARRGSTPRTSAMTEVPHLSRSTSSLSSHSGGDEISSLSQRLRKLNEAGAGAESIPFRIKFVNNKNEATMADVYPSEEYKDVIRKIVEKLRMPHQSNYVLLYYDTDDEEIGVACTDNLREMFSIFEPGSRLQLRIVQLNVNNSGALDSIPSIWDNGHTPNVFLHHHDHDGGSGHESDSSGHSVDLGKLKLASAAVAATAATVPPPLEMEEKPKPAPADSVSVHSHLAVEDIAEVAVAAATAASAAASAAALASAVGTKTEVPGDSAASNKAEPPSSPPASPNVSPTAAAAAGDKVEPGGDELRTAIAMMSTNLTLAIESLGTKLATNFDRLSNEQAKIIDSLAHAKTTSDVCAEAAATAAAAAALVATTAVVAEEKTEEVEVEEKVEIKVEEKVEVTTETKTDEGVTKSTTVETKTTDIKVEDVETKTTDIKVEDVETKTTEIKVEDVKGKSEPEIIHVEVVDVKPPPAVVVVAPAPAPPKKDDCGGTQHRADIFKEHLAAANQFAFHTNPYASSFFQHGFSEVGMPSYIRHPCMLRSPFNEPSSCSSCTNGGCSACLTRKLAEMGYAVSEMQVSSLLGAYNGDSAR